MKLALTILFAVGSTLLAQSQSEMNAQAARDAAKADRELNKVYKEVLASLDDEGAKLLKASQRAWIAFRDAEAAFAADEARGGSMAPLLYSGTVGRLIEQRTRMLKERLGTDETPAPQPPRAEPIPEPRPVPTPKPEASTTTEPAGAKSQALAAQGFFDAYKAHNRKAAAMLASETALKKLVWKTSAGDNPTLKLMDNTHIYYEGGGIELDLARNSAGRWFIADVTLFAD
jgi:uncharacterized protein YecT (DUF1311 family)